MTPLFNELIAHVFDSEEASDSEESSSGRPEPLHGPEHTTRYDVKVNKSSITDSNPNASARDDDMEEITRILNDMGTSAITSLLRHDR